MQEEALRTSLGRLSKQELLELAKRTAALERRLELFGPQDDDELHAWIKRYLGVDIPRVAVVQGHSSPFQFLADLYFERTQSAVAMANRGGSKTFLVAVLWLLNGTFKPGTEMATVGAIEMQARRAYMHLQKLIAKAGEQKIGVDTSIMSETRWKTGSRVEILPGTVSAVNGPHPQKVHADEVELMDPEVYDESRNMSQGIMLPDGKEVKAQDIITSTRKRGHGLMQQIIDEIEEAERAGGEPPYKLYVWSIFETAQGVKSCQCAFPDLPESERCPCEKIIKGKWDSGKPRTLKDVCGGKFAKSRGYISFNDVINTFTKVSRAVWEAQQECSKPSTAGLVMPHFRREFHGVRFWEPKPEFGPIYMGVDFGGTNPHAVNWYQLCKVDVDAVGLNGETKRIREGSIVCFDEVYRSEIGNVKLADLIVAHERRWREKYDGWRVASRFADPQAKAAKLDFAHHDPPLRTAWFGATRDIKEHIKTVTEWVEDDLFYVDVERCPMFLEEIDAWHYPRKRAGVVDDPEIPVDDFNHCMSNFRYTFANVTILIRHGEAQASKPVSSKRSSATATLARRGSKLVTAARASSATGPRPEAWRRRLGGFVDGNG